MDIVNDNVDQNSNNTKGRPRGCKASKNKYVVKALNLHDMTTWETIKEFASLNEISDYFGMKYNTIKDLNNGEQQVLSKVMKIDKLD